MWVYRDHSSSYIATHEQTRQRPPPHHLLRSSALRRKLATATKMAPSWVLRRCMTCCGVAAMPLGVCANTHPGPQHGMVESSGCVLCAISEDKRATAPAAAQPSVPPAARRSPPRPSTARTARNVRYCKERLRAHNACVKPFRVGFTERTCKPATAGESECGEHCDVLRCLINA